jgi:hypothetical protein
LWSYLGWPRYPRSNRGECDGQELRQRAPGHRYLRELVGVSEGDLIRRVEIDTEWRRSGGTGETLMSRDSLAKEIVKPRAKRVSDVMTREVITAQPETPLREIANLMEKYSIKRCRLFGTNSWSASQGGGFALALLTLELTLLVFLARSRSENFA